VVQHDNEHLTTAQISAYIDKELTPDELAFCNAHLPTCQTCRTLLTDLQFTSSLLHKLPQVAVPRSFVLPAQPTALPQGITSLQRQTPRAYPLWKRSLQAVSTLAALLGLVFILLGAFTALPSGSSQVATTASSSGQSSTAQPRSIQTPVPGISATPQVVHRHANVAPTAKSGTAQQSPTASPGLPAILDLTQPLGRLGVGALLLLLGIVGFLLTRTRSRRRSLF
jgi:hypothetical protein